MTAAAQRGPSATARPPAIRLIVTRPQAQADAWVEQLLGLGLTASAVPLLGIADPPDPSALQRAWSELARYRLVMFVSPNAVERFFALAAPTAAWPPSVLAAGTGPGTAAALLSHGVPPQQVVCPAAAGLSPDSEALWQILQPRLKWPGSQALIVRGETGRNWLAEQMAEQGVRVDFVQAYRRIAPVLTVPQQQCLQAALREPAAHVWLLSSSEAVGHLRGLGVQPAGLGLRALATHARVAQAALDIGFAQVQVVAPTTEAVAAWVAAWVAAQDVARLAAQTARSIQSD